MTTEELLIPRYKCIAPVLFDRDELYNVGDIFTDDGIRPVLNQNGTPVYPVEWAKYPHLFQPLPWWKDRKVEEMPIYIKFTDSGIVYKIFHWEPSIAGWHMKNETDGTGITEGFASIDWHFKKDKCIPATEADYNAYLKELEEKGRDQPHPYL